MAIDAKTLAASKKYTNETVIGGGAIKGKNCTIDSISPITGGNRVTFKWTLDNGTVQTGTMDVLDGQDGGPGADGLGIDSVDIDTNNHLIITYDDGTTHDAGEIPGGGGTGEVTSVNGKKGVVKLYGTDIPVSDAVGAETIALSIDHLKASDLALRAAIQTLDAQVANKVDKEAGKGLSSNDFTTIDKTKLTNLEPIYLIGSGLNLDPATGKLSSTGMSIPIDTQLDPTSPNPVQNQAIAVPMQALQGSMAGKADKNEVNQIKLDVQQLQGSMSNKADKSDTYTKNEVNAALASKADKTEVNQIQLNVQQLQGSVLALKLDVNQLSGSLIYKADKTDLDSWIGPEYTDANGEVIFDNLDDNNAYKLFGWDRTIRIDGQPTKSTGTDPGTVKVKYKTDVPANTKCMLRMIKA